MAFVLAKCGKKSHRSTICIRTLRYLVHPVFSLDWSMSGSSLSIQQMNNILYTIFWSTSVISSWKLCFSWRTWIRSSESTPATSWGAYSSRWRFDGCVTDSPEDFEPSGILWHVQNVSELGESSARNNHDESCPLLQRSPPAPQRRLHHSSFYNLHSITFRSLHSLFPKSR